MKEKSRFNKRQRYFISDEKKMEIIKLSLFNEEVEGRLAPIQISYRLGVKGKNVSKIINRYK